ncbi:MAG: hypothetical protein GC192_17275 [Bacteroidetes bacterium]|nr:hypothetical protein [Bacteroidota bacterium]
MSFMSSMMVSPLLLAITIPLYVCCKSAKKKGEHCSVYFVLTALLSIVAILVLLMLMALLFGVSSMHEVIDFLKSIIAAD